MKSKWIPVILATLVLAGCGTDSAEQGNKEVDGEVQESSASPKIDISKSNLSKVFAEGTYPADIMTLGLTAELNEKIGKVTEKMQMAIAENEVWYSETLASLEEGEAFPYDEKLGLTEEEYEFLLQADQHLQFGKIGESEITITRADEQPTILNPSSAIVKELTISEDGNTIQSDVGELAYVEEIVASDQQTITGRWNGHFYRIGDENSQQVVQISIGKFEDRDEKIMYIELFEQGQEQQFEFFVF